MAEPRLGSGGKSQIYTNSLQLSDASLCSFDAKFVLHLPLTPEKISSDLHESHNPTWLGRVGGTRGYATVSQYTGNKKRPGTYGRCTYDWQLHAYMHTYMRVI